MSTSACRHFTELTAEVLCLSNVFLTVNFDFIDKLDVFSLIHCKNYINPLFYHFITSKHL